MPVDRKTVVSCGGAAGQGKGRPEGAAFCPSTLAMRFLLGVGSIERVANRCKGEVKCAADLRCAGHDRECDERGDQAIFDSGGAGFIFYKARKKLRHSRAPYSTC